MPSRLKSIAAAALYACLLSSLRAAPLPPLPFKLIGVLKTNTAFAARQFTDNGDHFLGADGKKIPLLRVSGEISVRYDNDKTPARPVGLTPTRHAGFRDKARFEIVRAPRHTPQTLAREAGVRFAYPVFVDPKSKTRMMPTDELLIRLADGVTPANARAALAAAGVTIVKATGPAQWNSYLVRLNKPKTDDPLAVSRHLAKLPQFRWAAPNFVRELRWHALPNDPYFPWQQSLHNTGQNGATPGADIRAAAAWDITTGTNAITIAIIDEGVDTNQTDLVIEPGGWDFANDDADPSPGFGHAHGTACAGIAAATLNNNHLVAGVAGGCRILPIKIADDTGEFSTDQIIGNAIAYAATRADVLSNSWGGGDPNPYIDAAIDYAQTFGRAGKGCPAFFSTGNSASTWLPAYLSFAELRDFMNAQPGMSWTTNYHIGFGVNSDTAPFTNQTIRLDNICLLATNGYDHLNNILAQQDFEDWFFWWFYYDSRGFPVNTYGWWLAGDVAWEGDNTDTFPGTGGSISATAPALTSTNQWAWFLTPMLPLTGDETLVFHASFSFSNACPFYLFLFDANLNGAGWIIHGYDTVSSVNTNLAYPASHPKAIAVGASTDCDYRSDFSQYDGKLDFVAPGGGGWNQIVSLDITGTNGYANTDATLDFGGTSAACPHAAGIAALLLSIKPSLTATEVRDIMRRTCDKIGGVTYDGGTNLFYGYGRLNAWRALSELVPDLAVNATATPEPVALGSNITYTITITNLNATIPATGITVTNTLSSGVIFLDATATQGTCVTDAFNHVIATLGDFPTNSPVATITINATANSYGYLTNTTVATLNEPDANRADNTATAITTVPAANLAVSQYALPQPPIASLPLTYFIIITNLGPTAATSVVVTDALPAGVTFLAASATQGSCTTDAFANVIANLGAIALNASATIRCTVQLPATTPANLTNTFTVTANEIDLDPANNITLGVAPLDLDTVGDGIPDAWRAARFGGDGASTNELSAATADPDGDGFTNYQEYLAGTDPRNSASALRIQNPGFTNGVFTVHFDTVTNKLYRVEHTGNLRNGAWNTLNSAAIIGTGTTVAVPDPTATGQTQRFYRVRLAFIP